MYNIHHTLNDMVHSLKNKKFLSNQTLTQGDRHQPRLNQFKFIKEPCHESSKVNLRARNPQQDRASQTRD